MFASAIRSLSRTFRRPPCGLEEAFRRQHLWPTALLLSLVVSAAGAGPAQAETVELPIDGLTATADLVTADRALSEGPVVLLLHGTFATKDQETMEALQTALAERGLPSLAITLTLEVDRRTQTSSCEGVHRHRHSDAVAEIDAWIDWLAAQGAETVVLAGHSRGGAQSALYLSGSPSPRVRGAVLLAPMTENPAQAAAEYRSRFDAELGEVVRQAEVMAPDAVLTVPGFVYCPQLQATAASFLSYHGPTVERDTPTLLAKGVPVPVLVIAAGADEVVPDLVERMEAAVDDPSIRLEVVEDADHRFLDFYAEDAADLIASFVEELAGR